MKHTLLLGASPVPLVSRPPSLCITHLIGVAFKVVHRDAFSHCWTGGTEAGVGFSQAGRTVNQGFSHGSRSSLVVIANSIDEVFS